MAATAGAVRLLQAHAQILRVVEAMPLDLPRVVWGSQEDRPAMESVPAAAHRWRMPRVDRPADECPPA